MSGVLHTALRMPGQEIPSIAKYEIYRTSTTKKRKRGKTMKFWLVTGSQHLYGKETLDKVAENVKIMTEKMNQSGIMQYPDSTRQEL